MARRKGVEGESGRSTVCPETMVDDSGHSGGRHGVGMLHAWNPIINSTVIHCN